MSNQDAIFNLDQAIREITKAREEAERDIAEIELENLRISAEDCKSGLMADLKNSETEAHGSA